jgi:hypothetical protein
MTASQDLKGLVDKENTLKRCLSILKKMMEGFKSKKNYKQD